MLCDSCETEAHCRTFGCLDETPKVTEKTDVSALLEERGKRYGKFVNVAKATSDIQGAVYDNFAIEKLNQLPPDMSVALDMICHKMARIAVGDHNYIDNWHDIAGYAQLVADRLNGIER